MGKKNLFTRYNPEKNLIQTKSVLTICNSSIVGKSFNFFFIFDYNWLDESSEANFCCWQNNGQEKW